MVTMNEEMIEIRSGDERKMLRKSDLTDEQLYIAKRFSTMIREVLTAVETAMPSDSKQNRALRSILNDKMYGARNDMFEYFK